MRLLEYPDRARLMQALASRLADELRGFLRAGPGRVSLSVPGGSTPGPVFDRLAHTDLDWSRVTVLPNDERWVHRDSPRSNSRLLRERLLRGKAAAAQLVDLVTDDPTPEDGIAAIAAAVAPHLPLSLLLLGMGADMHTASLFPGGDGLAAALAPDAPPVMAIRAPGAEEPRLSLTAPVLRGAASVHLLITGDDKRAALQRAAGLPPDQAPVACVLERATVHWAA